MNLCLPCLSRGSCRNRLLDPVAIQQLDNHAFLQDGRNCGWNFARKLELSAEQFPDALLNRARRSDWTLLEDADDPVDFEVLFRPSGISKDEWDKDGFELGQHNPDALIVPEHRFYYQHNFLQECGPNPYNTYPQRMRAVLSLLKVLYPEESRYWGLRAANDRD